MAKVIRIWDDTALQRQIDLNASKHLAVFDSADVEVMDIEAHSSRHKQGGADEVVGIVLQGLDANKPAAGMAGRFWLSTDTLALYYDDGTAWNLVGILGGLDLTSHSTRHDIGGADEIAGLASHAARHAYGGADALSADALRFSQIDKVFGTESTVSVPATSTSVIGKGIYYARCGPNTTVEYSPDGGTTWVTLVTTGGAGLVISDGTNVRFNNAGEAAENSYLLPIE